jgi:hypothetical protein
VILKLAYFWLVPIDLGLTILCPSRTVMLSHWTPPRNDVLQGRRVKSLCYQFKRKVLRCLHMHARAGHFALRLVIVRGTIHRYKCNFISKSVLLRPPHCPCKISCGSWETIAILALSEISPIVVETPARPFPDDPQQQLPASLIFSGTVDRIAQLCIVWRLSYSSTATVAQI